MARAPKILIKGAGEHASGTAHRLFACGYPVVMTEMPVPRAVRRAVSFCAAVFVGETQVEGVPAKVHTIDDVGMLDAFDHSYIPVFVDPECTLRQRWKPDVVIDGRIVKRNLDNDVSDAPLVIGLGPGLVAGQDVHHVIETHRGHDLGRIISHGTAAPDTGIPGGIAGSTVDRVLRAPAAGGVECLADIGDRVERGDVVARVADLDVHAAVGGVLRGIIYPGSMVEQGQKLGDVDPRGRREACETLSDKARTISGAVLELVLSVAGCPR